MDPIQLDFYLSSIPLVLAMITALYVAARGNVQAGMLLFIACGFLEAHMTIYTFFSDSFVSYEEVTLPDGSLENNLVFAQWYQIFMLVKAASLLGLPVALWRLGRREKNF